MPFDREVAAPQSVAKSAIQSGFPALIYRFLFY
jgi:hypothetical protein